MFLTPAERDRLLKEFLAFKDPEPSLADGYVDDGYNHPTVYVIRTRVFNEGAPRPGLIKVGYSAEPQYRLHLIRHELKRAHGFLVPASLAFLMQHSNALEVEQEAHRPLGDKRATGEWFDCSEQDAIEAVRKAGASTPCV